MSKDYKGYELIKEIADGNIKDGTKIGVFDLSVCDIFVTNIVYKNKKLLWLEGKFDTSYLVNPNCYFRIVEEQEEIDIQEINLDFARLGQFSIKNAKGQEEILEVLFIQVQEKMKELARKINYLDKNIKEK